jgi:transcriptional regulator with XRE-family HTH domain
VPMADITFGRLISDARKKLNLMQKDLAARIMREDGHPISPQYLNDIERDRRRPSSDHMVQQFAKALDLNADYLHYLNGRFPEQERRQHLTEAQFNTRLSAFRKGRKI